MSAGDRVEYWTDYTEAALILGRLGEEERSKELLAGVEEFVDNKISFGPWDYLLLAYLNASLGRADAAIDALRNAHESGTLYMWRRRVEDPIFDSLRDEPEFRELIDETAARMALQLERVREMERGGELPMLPVSVSTN